MRNVILFIVAAAAALVVVDANPSHSHIAALLRRQLPGIDPSSNPDPSACTSACAPLAQIADTCSSSIECLCSQKNYDALAPCIKCLSPDNAQAALDSFVSECKQQGHKVNAPGGSSSGDTSSDPSTTGPAGSASSAGSSSPSSKEPGGLAKSNGSVVGPNAFGALGLSAVAAVVTIATLGVSFG